MATKKLKIKNRLGIHARPAAAFAKIANQFQSDIRIQKDGLDVNGKSIMGIMMLAAAKGNIINVVAEGDDHLEAIEALEKLVENKFGED